MNLSFVPPTSLDHALAVASPRISPRPMTFTSLAVYCAVLVLWLVLFARAFSLDGVLAWSAGIAYIFYDTFLMALVAWQTWPLIKGEPDKAQGAESTKPTLAVVIAAHNEAQALPATLHALCAQTFPADLILIADDGSTDATAQMLQEKFGLTAAPFGELSPASSIYPSIHWLRLPHSGKAGALNAAILKITTDVIVTIDADTRPAPGALAEMRTAFGAEPTLVAAGGILVPVCADGAFGQTLQWFQRHEYIRNIVARFAWMQMRSLLLISGAFAGFRRDALLAVGGFDPKSLVEDYELTHRLHRYSVDHALGWQLRMVGAAHARTDAPDSIGAFLTQRRRWFAGFLQSQYWNRDMTANRRYGNLGRWMLPIKALDTLQPIYGLTAFVLLAILVANEKFDIAAFAFSIIGAKLLIDFVFQVWTIHLYRKLTGERTRTNFVQAILAAAIEPFSFQILRHLGAAWGWLSFLTGTQQWGASDKALANSKIQQPQKIQR